ncbi:hypothetical protein CLF_101673 [Clonorchis sinensis]|uniref:Uncharacterized protein n=1 Tax=Clonorchis sinensis TaxID=79923 RepID=G7Y6A4_CLOSI|nr:hypothetical protein CLF_101673 [Clonorchis sinensis]
MNSFKRVQLAVHHVRHQYSNTFAGDRANNGSYSCDLPDEDTVDFSVLLPVGEGYSATTIINLYRPERASLSCPDSDGSLSKGPLLAFHQLFTDVITPHSLMNSFHEDVKESIRIMRVINRLFHLPQAIPTNLMTELLNSYIQAAKPVTFRQTNDLTAGNVTSVSQNVTSVLGIGLCKDSGLISYATSGTEMISPAIPRKVCAELKNAAKRHDLSFTEETIYERFQMNWVANQCEQIAGRPAVIRVAVRPVEGTGKLQIQVDHCSEKLLQTLAKYTYLHTNLVLTGDSPGTQLNLSFVMSLGDSAGSRLYDLLPIVHNTLARVHVVNFFTNYEFFSHTTATFRT